MSTIWRDIALIKNLYLMDAIKIYARFRYLWMDVFINDRSWYVYDFNLRA